MQRRP
ncbi:hypothetical protein D043_2737A, partial [Vibrio parahaemolyticus EKP-021]